MEACLVAAQVFTRKQGEAFRFLKPLNLLFLSLRKAFVVFTFFSLRFSKFTKTFSVI